MLLRRNLPRGKPFASPCVPPFPVRGRKGVG